MVCENSPAAAQASVYSSIGLLWLSKSLLEQVMPLRWIFRLAPKLPCLFPLSSAAWVVRWGNMSGRTAFRCKLKVSSSRDLKKTQDILSSKFDFIFSYSTLLFRYRLQVGTNPLWDITNFTEEDRTPKHRKYHYPVRILPVGQVGHELMIQLSQRMRTVRGFFWKKMGKARLQQ